MSSNGRAQPSENADNHQPAAKPQPPSESAEDLQPAAKRPPHSPSDGVQKVRGAKRKREDTALEVMRKKHEAIALVLQNIKSFEERGLDTSALESDLQALTARKADPPVHPVKRREGWEADSEVLAKIKESWHPMEIVGLMKEHVDDEEVQDAGCRALGNLWINAENKDEISGLSGINTVLAGMRAHAGAAGVQEQGCRALRQLCLNDDAIRVKVAGLGGIEAVVVGMRAHAGAAEVQAEGCWALSNLCNSNIDNVERMKAMGTVREVVLGAIAAHPSNNTVQGQGKHILDRFA
ncbi:hypothetical protein T484DRAFT_1799577 [Baffinella frigidus]|nr:hypothetical protein T484DRAFT_1799577 [Cryptophyta sp. CCMP2293]